MMNVAEILALPLEAFDKVITKDEVSQAAEIATALIEKTLVVDNDGNKLGYDLAEMLEAVHPANNNVIRCDKSDVDFFPDIPETGVWTDVLKDENGEVVLDEDGNAIVTGQRYYYEMGDELTLYDEDPSETEWFQAVDEEAYNKVLLAKRECMACPAQKQCLIWSLLSDTKVLEDQKKNRAVPVEDRIDVTLGVTGGRSAAARQRILNRMDFMKRKGIYPSDEAMKAADIIVEAAKNGVSADVAFDIIEKQYAA